MLSGAFFAATLLPGGSEILLLGLIENDRAQWLELVIVASIGNTLGSITSYYLGRLGRFAQTPEAIGKASYQRSLDLVKRYGVWSLLLAWLPLIGDLLCILAGWLKLPLLPSSILIFLGKSMRYLIIAFATLQLF